MDSQLIARATREISEFCLEAETASSFRRLSLEWLSKYVGIEAGALSYGTVESLAVEAIGVPATVMQENLHRWVLEFVEEEWERIRVPHAIADDAIFSPQRRTALECGDFLVSQNIHGYVGRAVFTERGFCWMTFARKGRHRARFRDDEILALSTITSLLAVGELAQASKFESKAARARDAWIEAHGVTPSERKVIDLVERGLTNRDIGCVLGLSANTIRNQLSSSFRKLGVSTRTELSFAMTHLSSNVRDSEYQRKLDIAE